MPVIHRAYRFRLYPSDEQVLRLRQLTGAARFVYNLALEQRRDWWRQYRATTGKHISWASQSKELTEVRRELPWLREVPRSICEQALRDLESTYRLFFKRGGDIHFRNKERNSSFRLQGREGVITALNAKWATIKLWGVGCFKFRATRPVAGKWKNITVSEIGGAWFVSIATEQEGMPGLVGGRAVGIDRGIATSVALSDGQMFSAPKERRKEAATAARAMSRAKKGSRRFNKAKARVAKIAATNTARRKHWLHELSTSISRQYGYAALEQLRIRSMTKSAAGTIDAPGTGVASKRGLNRSILEQGWHTFSTMLEYKLAARGGQVFYVNPAYTSQTCSACGCISSESRKSQAIFHCIECDHQAHADVNAAINILRRSPAGVEGAGYGPDEARTGEMLTHLENLAA